MQLIVQHYQITDNLFRLVYGVNLFVGLKVNSDQLCFTTSYKAHSGTLSACPL